MENKTCSCCLLEKAKDKFYTNTFGSLDFKVICIECINAGKHRKAKSLTTKKDLNHWATAIVSGLNGHDY